ncbi:hypothetical protein EV1_002533 [Malus domestica]
MDLKIWTDRAAPMASRVSKVPACCIGQDDQIVNQSWHFRFHLELHLTESRYALDLLECTKFINAKPISTPVSSGQKLSAFGGESYSNPELYRSVVGALHYMTITRPDPSYVVNQVCQFMHSSNNTHWRAVKEDPTLFEGYL